MTGWAGHHRKGMLEGKREGSPLARGKEAVAVDWRQQVVLATWTWILAWMRSRGKEAVAADWQQQAVLVTMTWI